MNNFIKVDSKRAKAKWSSILENMGISNSERIDWMSEVAEITTVYENAYVNMGSITGMGAVAAAQPSSNIGVTIGGYNVGDTYGTDGVVGSGDYGQQLVPVAMKIAGQTIGLDLVAVKPVGGTKIDLMFVDFEYDNTDDDANSTGRPQVFKVNYNGSGELASVKAYLNDILFRLGISQTQGGLTSRVYVKLGFTNSVAYTTLSSSPTVKTDWVEFLGYSRIDNLPMFRAFRQPNITAGGMGAYSSWAFDADKNTFGSTGAMVDVLDNGFARVTGWTVGTGSTSSAVQVTTASCVVEMISALEDHIPGVVTNFNGGSKQADYPMTRLQEENTYPNVIAPKVTSKTIQVGSIEISTALKRTEIEDIKANLGIDIVQKMESILVNELSQTISKQIVNKLFEMGNLNRGVAPENVTSNISDGKIFDFDVTAYLTAAPGGETSHAIQRKLISKIMNASNFIATEGRVGPAQFIVTNGKYAAVLHDIAGYTINPTKSKFSGAGQLYPVGTIGDITIYVDPYMRYNDNRILVGRKNAADQPGIVFCPYLMAQSISLISEATFAPRMLLRSRYAIAELGWYPQKQYMTVKVYDINNVMM
jgi:hypothetical protein